MDNLFWRDSLMGMKPFNISQKDNAVDFDRVFKKTYSYVN